MISPVEQPGHNAPDRLKSGLDIRIFQSTAAIVKADDSAVAHTRKYAFGDGLRGQFPVEANHAPHDSPQPETPLHFPKTEPPDSIRRPHERRRLAADVGQLFLRAFELICYKRGTREGKIWVRVGVISDFMPRGSYRS